MGNCSSSGFGGFGEAEEDPVELCRERKRLLKSAVERRYGLADAHRAYFRSLYSVAAAINLFVARHSAPTPILITLPSDSDTIPSPPPLLQQTQTKTESVTVNPSLSSASSSVSGCEKQAEGMGFGYYFSGTEMQSPTGGDYGWDFFNPFDGVRAAEEAAMMSGLCRSTDEILRAVREKEGIPELEEEEVEVVVVEEGMRDGGGVVKVEEEENRVAAEEKEERGLTVTDSSAKERELLDALRDVEDQFIRAYDAGKEVSRMLEVNRVHSGLDEMKDNPSELAQAITWHRSASSLSSSYRTELAPSSGDTVYTESKSDLFEDYGGMESGSHSQTLGRLYAWEKKLYEEVKAGDHTRQVYEKKCLKLRNKDAKGADSCSVDKRRASLRDLYTRIWVALRSIETISFRIQKVRDEELHPQLIELLQSLMKTWKIMLESHETQKQIMMEVKSFTCPSYVKFCCDSQRHVTVKLEAELRNWRTCFMSYIAAMRAYIETLDGWLTKFFVPDIEYYSRCRSSVPLHRTAGAPPLLVLSHNWSDSTKKLPDKAVSYAMKGIIKNTRLLWVKQGEEQQQKRKVDSLAKELDRKVLALKKAENKVLESKLSDAKTEPEARERMEYLAGRKDLLSLFRKKLDLEKAKHHNYMQETQRVRLDGFKIGLVGVFDSLSDFSRDCHKLYGELLVHSEKEVADKAEKNPSCIESSQVEDVNRRLKDGGDGGRT